MDVSTDEKSKITIDKNILDLFWKLCDKNTDTRLNACSDILYAVWKKQEVNENELSKDLQYCVERLVKGLASPRDAARLGYTLLLTEIFKKFPVVQIEEVLELMKKHLSLSGKQEKRDIIFGQLFAYTAIVRSGRLLNSAYLSEVVISLFELSYSRSYILNATYEVILDMFSQLTTENFKDIWPSIKKKLPSNWETSSAQSLWLLFLCIRMFPNAVSSKYMEKHLGKDIFASENVNNLKKIIKQTTSSLPNLHPTCIEFLLLVKQRTDHREIWNAVIDDNLFNEPNEKSFVGFEMIKFALEESPEEVVLEVVLSPKFRTLFSKCFLNAKHALNPSATQLADFLCTFVKTKGVPNMQITILKAFLQPPGTVLLDHILKKKEVSLIIQNLLPDAVKKLCDFLKTVFLKEKLQKEGTVEVNNMKRFQAVHQIAYLVAHPAVLTDLEWRLDVIKFLYLHSFFTLKEATSEIPYCETVFEPLSDALKNACMNAFYKAVNSLHFRTEKQQSSLNSFLELSMNLTDYVETLMNATENVEASFSIEKVQNSWSQLKTIIHKLKKKSKKDNLTNESSAFQVLFLQLGLHLFQDPDDISNVLEELYICCKKSLKSHKHDVNVENEESEPPWIGVVIDILLSLLSKSSNYYRSMVTYIFPLFCPFIDQNALQQILDVINPSKGDEDMLVDEDESGGEQELDFASGSSSEESEEEKDNQPVDEEFKKKVRQALGAAADDSEAESIVLSDSEMFKLDSALSEAFKSRVKSVHTQQKAEDKTMLHFQVRCLDIILVYLKSEPPMHLVLMCLEPVLAAFECGHQSKHQKPLLYKALSVLEFMAKTKKFQHHEGVSRTELKRLLDVLIPKCHKEINMSVSQKLSYLCVFIVLCYRKLRNADSPDKKSKTPSYMKIYLSALESFVSSGSSHMLPHFFTHLMEACPEVAWYFTEPCKTYAFNNNIRLFKRTQCLGLLLESLKYSKSQKDITDEQWCDFANSVIPFAIECLKNAFDCPEIKPMYCTELLSLIYTLHCIIKDKTNETLLNKYTDLLPLLSNACNKKMKKLSSKGISLKNKIISSLGRVIESIKSKPSNKEAPTVEEPSKKKRKSTELDETLMDSLNEDFSPEKKKRKNKKHKKSIEEINRVDNDS